MIKLALLTTTALFLAGPAFAGGDYKPEPPKPTPTGNIDNKSSANAAAIAAAAAAAKSSATSAATGGNATGGQGGAGGAGGRGGDQSQSTTVNNTGGGNGGGWNGSNFPASSAYAPSFALSSICQEAISGGASIFWAGLSGGKVYTLDFCKMTMQADYYRKQGREDMAKAAECKFSEARSLYRETGTPCREDMTKAELTQPATPAQRAGYIGPNGFVPYPAGYKP